jgi:hypothetical protein
MTRPPANPYPDTPDARMLVALLAATDPLGLLAAGGHPDGYQAVAAAVLHELAIGGDLDDLLRLMVGAGENVEAVAAFVRSATAWWHEGERRWTKAISAA